MTREIRKIYKKDGNFNSVSKSEERTFTEKLQYFLDAFFKQKEKNRKY